MIQTWLMALDLSLILQSARKIHNPSIQVRNESAIGSAEKAFDKHFTEHLFRRGPIIEQAKA